MKIEKNEKIENKKKKLKNKGKKLLLVKFMQMITGFFIQHKKRAQ